MELLLNSPQISTDNELFIKQRVIRVFISSTFKDMEEEREELIKYIFPKLRKLCDERGISWSEVDLRWGVTDEQKSDGQVLPLCLAEIDNCTPFFIGVLGERYGWIPEIDEILLKKYPWLNEYTGTSVTEIEILHGALLKKKKPMYGLFYFRDPQFVENFDNEKKEIYLENLYPSETVGLDEEDIKQIVENRQNKLNHLKNRIRNSGYHLRENFSNAKHLGNLVYEDFSQLIDQLFPKGDLEDELQKKSYEHTVFAMIRSKYFVGREKYLQDISDYVTKGGNPLVLTGESGSGKSSLLAYWALNYINNNDNKEEKLPLIMHYIGATPSSGDSVSLMRRVTMELIRIFDLDLTLPTDSDKLRETFALSLDMVSEKGKANEEGKAIIILDAINQLDNLVDIQDLLWLPSSIPPNIRLIISTTKGLELKEFQKREWSILELELLSDEECKETISKYLSAFGKTLEPIYFDEILENTMCKNPLFLRTILDEIRIYGNYDDLNKKIEHYVSSTSITDLFIKKIQRLEEDYDRERDGLVKDALTFLWASRTGLMESELLDLLGTKEKRLSSSIWSPLYLAIESSLLNHSGYIRLFHDYFRSAIESYYFNSNEEKQEIHNILANYYSQENIISTRMLQELPWQLMSAKEWDKLYNLFKDMNFVSKLWEHDPFDVKSYWVNVEENTKAWRKNTTEELTMLKAYDSMIYHPENFDIQELQLVAMLMEDAYSDVALDLYYYINNYYEKTNRFDYLIESISHISRILIIKGKYQKAMDILKYQEERAREHNLWEIIQESLGNQAETLTKWGEYDEAMILLKQQEEICREYSNKMGLQNSLGNQAKILRKMQNRDFDKVHGLLEEMERINVQIGNKDGLQRGFGIRALILRNQNKVEEALNLLQLQEKMCRSIGNFEDLQECLGYQVECMYELQNIREGFLILQEQESICIHIKHKDGLQRNYAMNAKIYSNYKMKKYDKALQFLEKQERICRELANKADLHECLGRQAYINIKINKIDRAIELIQEQEAICREQNYQVGLLVSLGFKSMVYKSKGKILKALETILEQEEISRKIEDNSRLIISLKNKASYMNRLGEIEKAYRIYQEQEAICTELEDRKGLTNALYGQAGYFAMKGDYERALSFYKHAGEIAALTNNKQDLIRIQLNIEKIESLEEKHNLLDEDDLFTNFQVIPPIFITIMEMIHANQGLSFREIKSLLLEKDEYQDMQDNDFHRITFQLSYRELVYSVKKTFNGKKKTFYYLSDLGEYKLQQLSEYIPTNDQPNMNEISIKNKSKETSLEVFVNILKENKMDFILLYTDDGAPIVKFKQNPVKYVVVCDNDDTGNLSSQLEFIHSTTTEIYLVTKNEGSLYNNLMPAYYKWVKGKYGKIQNMNKNIKIFITFIKKFTEEEEKWKRVSW